MVWATLPYALGVTTVIFGKHIDKLEADQQKNINTLPVLIGEKAARQMVLGMMILPCGTRSIRFRPPLDVTDADIDAMLGMLARVLERL